jgi:hypothetical protein
MGFERLGTHTLEKTDRTWIGNDDSARNQHGVIRLAESPVTLRLSWRPSAMRPSVIVGCFRLDLRRLLANGLVRIERAGSVRVRFVHDEHGTVYLQVKRGEPQLEVGRI